MEKEYGFLSGYAAGFKGSPEPCPLLAGRVSSAVHQRACSFWPSLLAERYCFLFLFRGFRWGPLGGPQVSMWVHPVFFISASVLCFAFPASVTPSLAEDIAAASPPRGYHAESVAASGSPPEEQNEVEAAADEAANKEKPLVVGGRRIARVPTSRSPRGSGGSGRASLRAAGGEAEGGFGEEEEVEEEDEEELLSTDDLEMLRLIRLARDEQEGQGWRTLNLRFSVHVVMWLALALVVYFVVSGATRGDEKKKSLESHKAVLKATVDELVEGKKRKHQLQQEREGLIRERNKLLKEAEALTTQLEAVMRDIQQTAAVSEEEGEGRPEGGPEAKTAKETAAAGDEGGAPLALRLTVPRIDKGCREANSKLQDLLLHQGDSTYMEETIRQYVVHLLRWYRVPEKVFEAAGQGPQHVSLEDMDKLERWYLCAARGIGLDLKEKGLPVGAGGEGEVEAASKTPEQSRRERQLGVLGLTSAMLRRKTDLDFSFKQLQQEHGEIAAEEESLLSSIRSVRAEMRTRLEALAKDLQNVAVEAECTFKGNQQEEAHMKQVVMRVAVSLRQAVEDLLVDKVVLAEEENSAQVVEAAATARRRLLQQLHENTKLVLNQAKLVDQKGDGASSSAKAELLAALWKASKLGISRLVASLGHLHAQSLALNIKQKDVLAAGAVFNERRRTLESQMQQTRAWIEAAQILFSRL
ncbi:hypothetical protein Efla_007101 [Eimeria flavescens]